MVSLELDNFILDKDTTYWHVVLSNGQHVFEDDGRPSYEENSAWRRLVSYCKSNNLSISKMYITFRSNKQLCLSEEDIRDSKGVFFRKGVIGGFGQIKKPVKFFYVVGVVKNDRIFTTRWIVPHMIKEEVEDRPVSGNEETIIWTQSHASLENRVDQHTCS